MRASAVYHYADKATRLTLLLHQLNPFKSRSPASAAITTPAALDRPQSRRASQCQRTGSTVTSRISRATALGEPSRKSSDLTTASPTAPLEKTRPVGASTAGTDGLLAGGNAVLNNQANLVFPDGRFANGPLRSALQVAETNRTLAQKAAIDSTNCALDILEARSLPIRQRFLTGQFKKYHF
jgi:hypothetical protein